MGLKQCCWSYELTLSVGVGGVAKLTTIVASLDTELTVFSVKLTVLRCLLSGLKPGCCC